MHYLVTATTVNGQESSQHTTKRNARSAYQRHIKGNCACAIVEHKTRKGTVLVASTLWTVFEQLASGF